MDERVPNPQLPVVIEPHSMQQRAGIVGTIMASLGMMAVVVLVLYGLSRPEGPQTASAPSQTSQQAATPEPSTTGQGQSSEPEKQPPSQGKGERSDSATTGAQPSDQPRPPQQ